MDAYDTLNILTLALGFPLFETRPQATDKDVFLLTGNKLPRTWSVDSILSMGTAQRYENQERRGFEIM